MKKMLCLLPGLAMLLALAGCCANDTCVCNDAQADALFFSFKIGGADGFQASDVDTLYLVRTTHPDATTNTLATSDSVLRVLPLAAGGAALTRDTIVINNATPFALTGGNTKLSAYDYHISAYRADKTAKNGRLRYTFIIKNIQLAGDYKASGCCTCYENTSKQFDISTSANAQTFQMKKSTDSNDRSITLLTK